MNKVDGWSTRLDIPKDIEGVRRFFRFLIREEKLNFSPDHDFEDYVDAAGNPKYERGQECLQLNATLRLCHTVCYCEAARELKKAGRNPNEDALACQDAHSLVYAISIEEDDAAINEGIRAEFHNSLILEVWNKYKDDPEGLRREAEAIRARWAQGLGPV
jgi:hypothetical protein